MTIDMSDEITNNMKSLEYYAKRIREAVSGQFDIFFNNYDMHGEEGEAMINALRGMYWGASEIDSWCIVMQKNLDKCNGIKLPRLKQEVES